MQRRRLRLLGLLVVLIFGGLMLYAMVAALTSQTLEPMLTLGLMGLLLVPAVALAAGAMWYADRLAGKALATANHLVSSTLPQSVLLQAMEAAAAGSGWAILQLPNGDRVTAIFSDWFPRPLLPQGVEVRVYAQSLARDSVLVALPPDGIAVVGKVTDQAALRRRERIRQVALAIVLLVNLIYWSQWLIGNF